MKDESQQTEAASYGNVVVVIAAYNEGTQLADVVASLAGKCKTVVVVDDGSSDNTVEVALSAGAHVLTHPINLGQGAALQTGIDYALRLGADSIVTFDADGQHDSEELAPMLERLRTTQVDMVLGSRFLGRTVNMSRSKAITLRLAIWFTRLTSGLRLTDTHNGFRVLSRRAAQRIRIRQNRMAHASEILDQIAEKKLTFVEQPVTITYSAYSIAKGQRIMNAANIVKDQVMGKLVR